MSKQQEIKLRMRGKYSGHNIKANGVASLNLVFEYTELATIVPTIQLLNNNIDIIVRVEKETIRLGTFMLNQVTINHDGSSKIRFNGIADNLELDNLNKLIVDDLQIQVSGIIELEEEN